MAQHGPVRLHARGPATAKAVTVAEITKRRMRELHQNTQIGLDTDASGKTSPTICVVLSLAPLDASESGCEYSAVCSPRRQQCQNTRLSLSLSLSNALERSLANSVYAYQRRYQAPLTEEEFSDPLGGAQQEDQGDAHDIQSR